MPNNPRLTNVSQQHDSLSPEINQRGISIDFCYLISLIWIFQSYLKLRSENFPGKRKLPIELAVAPNKLSRPLSSFWYI